MDTLLVLADILVIVSLGGGEVLQRLGMVRDAFVKNCWFRGLGSLIVRVSGFSKNTGPPKLSGPLDRLNAILSLLQPLDRYRALSAIGSAIGRDLSRPISHPRTGGSSQPPRSKPLGGLNRAIVVL